MLAQIVSGEAAPGLPGLAVLAAALTWAVSPTFWGQAVVTEVYTLNALAVVALLWLLWRWREAVDAARAATAWQGLALAGRRRRGVWPGPGQPPDAAADAARRGLWLWAGRQAAGRPLARELLAALAAASVGLAVYAYLPLAAAANPSGELGDPDGPRQLWALISGHVYRGLSLVCPSPIFPAGWRPGAAKALRQFGGPWGAILALIGLWRLDRRLHAWWQTTCLIASTYSVYAIGYNTPDSFVYLIPAWCVVALWLAAGLAGWARLRLQPSAIRSPNTGTRSAAWPQAVHVKSVDGRAEFPARSWSP